MPTLKKLIFAVPFFGLLYFFFFQISPFFSDFGLMFNFELSILYKILATLASLGFACLMFVLFAALANDRKIVLPVGLLASFIPLLVFPNMYGAILMAGLIGVFPLSFFLLENRLKTYVNFSSTALFVPAIKSLATLILLVTSIAFYFSVDATIKRDGFKIPEALIDTALKFSMPSENVQGVQIAQVPNLTQEQIDFLRQNPDLLKQYGLDPSILNPASQNSQNQNTQTPASSSAPSGSGQSTGSSAQPKTSKPTSTTSTPKSPTSTSNDFIKGLVQAQFQKIIDPYIPYIAPTLALIFFVTFQSLFSLMAIFLPLIISLTFAVFEKTGFVKFEKEMREVKKLVV